MASSHLNFQLNSVEVVSKDMCVVYKIKNKVLFCNTREVLSLSKWTHYRAEVKLRTIFPQIKNKTESFLTFRT